ncbi:unnamed protein product [Psylliodes chrysocephalus]|uniref:Uncharacterized protein n=1 Tax=Psylliodes chrysocephalus TaxID=3402493 RepID=A0A9P0D3G6_9CUCU|nr:unnamed protein product [Psylliodes chrysocephala]
MSFLIFFCGFFLFFLQVYSDQPCLKTIRKKWEGCACRNFTEADLKKPMASIRNGIGPAAGSKRFKISRGTFQNKLKGEHTRSLGHPTVFTPAQGRREPDRSPGQLSTSGPVTKNINQKLRLKKKKVLTSKINFLLTSIASP